MRHKTCVNMMGLAAAARNIGPVASRGCKCGTPVVLLFRSEFGGDEGTVKFFQCTKPVTSCTS